MREQDSPRITDPIVELDVSCGGLGLKVCKEEELELDRVAQGSTHLGRWIRGGVRPF